jgi:hypothetical protein
MKSFLKRFLLLSSLLLSITCISAAGQPDKHQNRAIIHLASGESVLYHASFKVLKYHFTGLIVFKNISETEETRIVFLSETGLSIAEFTFRNNKAECLRTIPVLDRSSAKRYLEKLLEKILRTSTCNKVKTSNSETSEIVKCKGKKGRHYYLYTSNELKEITYRQGAFKNTTGYISREGITTRVDVKKGKKSKVEMKIVENAIK